MESLSSFHLVMLFDFLSHITRQPHYWPVPPSPLTAYNRCMTLTRRSVLFFGVIPSVFSHAAVFSLRRQRYLRWQRKTHYKTIANWDRSPDGGGNCAGGGAATSDENVCTLRQDFTEAGRSANCVVDLRHAACFCSTGPADGASSSWEPTHLRAGHSRAGRYFNRRILSKSLETSSRNRESPLSQKAFIFNVYIMW